LEDEFGVIARRYLEHVERLRVEPPPREMAPSMWRMLIETAVLRKEKNIQPNLAGQWLRAILSGTPLSANASIYRHHPSARRS
jgi:CRISPR-associated protein Csd1